MLNLLTQLGLNEKSASVYLALLELGSATVQEVAEKAGVKRTSIYNFLDELIKLGLITQIQEKHKTILIAEDPNVLKQRAREKEKEAEMYVQNIDQIVPSLLNIYNLPGEKPKMKFYRGIEGIKKAYHDTLLANEIIYAFSDYEKMMEAMTFDYMVDYANDRTRRGIQFYSIGPGGQWAKKAMALSKKQKRQMKINNQLKFDTEINIYGNKVALISFRRPYAAVIIEDRAIAQTLKSIWQVMWNGMK